MVLVVTLLLVIFVTRPQSQHCLCCLRRPGCPHRLRGLGRYSHPRRPRHSGSTRIIVRRIRAEFVFSCGASELCLCSRLVQVLIVLPITP